MANVGGLFHHFRHDDHDLIRVCVNERGMMPAQLITQNQNSGLTLHAQTTTPPRARPVAPHFQTGQTANIISHLTQRAQRFMNGFEHLTTLAGMSAVLVTCFFLLAPEWIDRASIKSLVTPDVRRAPRHWLCISN